MNQRGGSIIQRSDNLLRSVEEKFVDDSMAWLDRHAPNGVLDLYVNGNPPVEAMGDYVSKEFFKSTIAARSTTAELVELMDESRIVWALG